MPAGEELADCLACCHLAPPAPARWRRVCSHCCWKRGFVSSDWVKSSRRRNRVGLVFVSLVEVLYPEKLYKIYTPFPAFVDGVLGLPGAPFTIPYRSAGTADTDGEKAGEGSVWRLSDVVRVISGSASVIVTTLASYLNYRNFILFIWYPLRLLHVILAYLRDLEFRSRNPGVWGGVNGAQRGDESLINYTMRRGGIRWDTRLATRRMRSVARRRTPGSGQVLSVRRDTITETECRGKASPHG